MTESRRGSKVTGRYPLTIGRRRSTSTRPRTDVRTSVGQWTRRVLPRISEELMAAYRSSGDLHHLRLRDLPSKQRTIGILNDLMTILFPSWSGDSSLAEAGGERLLGNALNSLYTRLGEEIVRSLRYSQGGEDETSVEGVRERARGIVEALLRQLPVMKRRLSADVQAAYEDDPAAKSLEEIVLSYPCLYAVATYRIAHELYERGVPIIPRIMSEHAHSLTGVDIHPGARIGENFFIDHGTGVVIGETCEIGNNVRIYQGVTLGAKSLSHADVPALRGQKRHPTIEDDVVVYSGATILGPDTVIGKGAVIGGNVWITSSIPANTTVTIALPRVGRRR